MKCSVQKILFAVIFITAISYADAQTNVNGGIYTNTTWTLANSPYIVTDTVVVFPGYTLTIEPGVVVKFDNNKRLEIRQAKLIAAGTSTDSIAFTSNSVNPTPGDYSGIYLNGGAITSVFDYCSINYAATGIEISVTDSVLLSHSIFYRNTLGLHFIGNFNAANIRMSYCNFNNNYNGADIEALDNAVISYCNFSSSAATGLVLKDNGSSNSLMNPLLNHVNFYNNHTGLVFGMYASLLNNCNFENNATGLQEDASTLSQSQFAPYNNLIKNSIFRLNQTGVLNLWRSKIDSSTIRSNQTGMTSGNLCRVTNSVIDSNAVVGILSASDSIVACQIKNNATGIIANGGAHIIGNIIENNLVANIRSGFASGALTITENTIRFSPMGINYSNIVYITKNIIEDNDTGVVIANSGSTLSCNRICNNSTYGLRYLAVSNFNAANNYWCTIDSLQISASIYDGYDNVSSGLVNFMPLDTSCAPGIVTYINETEKENLSFSIFPNPATSELTVRSSEFGDKKIKSVEIYDAFGQKVFSQLPIANNQELIINVSGFASGIYIIQMTVGDKISRQKFVRQ